MLALSLLKRETHIALLSRDASPVAGRNLCPFSGIALTADLKASFPKRLLSKVSSRSSGNAHVIGLVSAFS